MVEESKAAPDMSFRDDLRMLRAADSSSSLSEQDENLSVRPRSLSAGGRTFSTRDRTATVGVSALMEDKSQLEGCLPDSDSIEDEDAKSDKTVKSLPSFGKGSFSNGDKQCDEKLNDEISASSSNIGSRSDRVDSGQNNAEEVKNELVAPDENVALDEAALN